MKEILRTMPKLKQIYPSDMCGTSWLTLFKTLYGTVKKQSLAKAKLTNIQKLVCLSITKVIRIMPLTAMEAFIGMTPLCLQTKSEAN